MSPAEKVGGSLWESLKADWKGWLIAFAGLVITSIRAGTTSSFGSFIVELRKEFPDATMALFSKLFACLLLNETMVSRRGQVV